MHTTHWLLATLTLTAFFWMPYVLWRFLRLGIFGTLANPTIESAAREDAWAIRAKAAHANATENLAVFAPLVLLSIALDETANPVLVMAAAIYFVARAVHYVAYAAGVPGVRTVGFLGGFGAQLTFVIVLAGALR